MKKIITFLCIIVLGAGCTDVIDIETPNREVSIAVQGEVTDVRGTLVKVSLTAGYFDQGQTPVINDATVQLLEDGIVVSSLMRDTVDGQYRSNYNGTVGSNYQIRVAVPSNSTSGFKESTWLSTPERMNRIFALDSFAIKYLDRNTFPQVFDEGFYALVYFQEPEGEGDVYRWKVYENGVQEAQTLLTVDDEFVDGGYFGGPNSLLPAFNYFGPIEEEGDSLGLEFFSISKAHQEYLALIGEQIFQVGGPFAAPPAAVIGNIYNEDDPDEFGFGYFVASAVSSGGITYNP